MRILEVENGFSPENIVRIRQGEPAQTDQGPIEQVLDKRQQDILEGVAEGLDLSQVGLRELQLGRDCIRASRVREIQRAGLEKIDAIKGHKLKLAGFFPIDRNDDVLKLKALESLTQKQLMFLESLSQGLSFEQIRELGISESPDQLQQNIRNKWAEATTLIKMIRMANGLRAIRVAQAKINDPKELLHEDFSLDEIVKL